MKISIKSPTELRSAFRYSVQGLKFAFSNEKAFRSDLVVFVICTIFSFSIDGLAICERVLMSYSVLMIVMAELANTAIEKIVDRISTERNSLSGIIKDLGSAVVFIAIVGAIMVWGVVLFNLYR